MVYIPTWGSNDSKKLNFTVSSLNY